MSADRGFALYIYIQQHEGMNCYDRKYCRHFASAKNVQKGSKECSLTVTDDSGTSKTYECSTDAEYLRQLMDELSADQTQEFSYEGSEGQYGLFINTVNGLTADYDKDHAYWAIYVDGEYAQNGADTQPVNDGDKFELKYEVSK